MTVYLFFTKLLCFNLTLFGEENILKICQSKDGGRFTSVSALYPAIYKVKYEHRDNHYTRSQSDSINC